jgi:hypothetical protein
MLKIYMLLTATGSLRLWDFGSGQQIKGKIGKGTEEDKP